MVKFGQERRGALRGVISPPAMMIYTTLLCASIFTAELLSGLGHFDGFGEVNGTVFEVARYIFPESEFTRDPDAFYHGVLHGGYSLAAILTVGYIWEGACCHNDQEAEASYIILTMGILVVTTAIFTTFRALFALRAWFFIIALIAYRLTRKVAAPQVLSGFFDDLYNELPRSNQVDPLAARITPEITLAIQELLHMEAGALNAIPEVAADSLLLLIMLGINLILASLGSNDLHMERHPYSEVFLILLCVSIAAYEFRIILRTSSRKTALHETLTRLLKDCAKYGHKKTLTKVLSDISVGSLMEVAYHSTMNLLTVDALEQDLLDVTAKAIIIDGLQKRGLRRQVRRQAVVRDIFLDTVGEDLSKLKNLIDYGGDVFNLYKLLYLDVTNAALRDEIIRHFEEEGRQLRELRGGSAGIKVLSDIDDTLYSSGGKFPAGCDTVYPKHVVYPGVLKLFEQLDWTFQENVLSCNLVFLSARPHIYKSMTEDHSYQLFQTLHREGRMHTLPTLLPGKLASGAWATVAHWALGSRAWKAVGEDKYRTFTDFSRLHSEYDFIFCGDNGQGDLLAGERMMSDQGSGGDNGETRPNVLCVLIREVLPDVEALTLEDADLSDAARCAAWRAELENKSIFFHRTYVGAALAVHRRLPQLMSLEKLRELALNSLESLGFSAEVHPTQDWTVAFEDLRTDVRQVAAALRAAGTPAPELEEQLQRLAATVGPGASRAVSVSSSEDTARRPLLCSGSDAAEVTSSDEESRLR
eukprot:TRINITY_DN65433_c0_g1_i1.p1 TRINITY_DN65433_c0_g1~~TRINITY_DN65433_c0_g1_i1.p1  ORF type:complete len:757 (-),score=177.80 TRINITY_DN65433_c0_g1_i1:112-2382(-)